jgi:hypothetical protein
MKKKNAKCVTIESQPIIENGRNILTTCKDGERTVESLLAGRDIFSVGPSHLTIADTI